MQILSVHKDHLCIQNNGTFKLNLDFLVDILTELEKDEQVFITENKMFQKFKNYAQIKEAFNYMEINENNVYDEIGAFKMRYNEFKSAVLGGASERLLKQFIADEEFMHTLKSLSNIGNINTDHLSHTEYIDFFVNYVLNVAKEMPKITLRPQLNTKSIEDYFQKEQTKGKNQYEKELYQMEEMLDEYGQRFSATPLNLEETRLADFYHRYFEIKDYETFKHKPMSNATKDVTLQYFEAIYWVFDYYYNNDNYINVWSYLHEKSPLLRDVLKLLKEPNNKKEVLAIIKNINTYNADPKKFFNTVEQLIYVSPPSKFTNDILPKEYQPAYAKAILEYPDFFVETKKIADSIWKLEKQYYGYGPIDCHSVPYLTKCVIKHLERKDATFDEEVLKFIRTHVKKITDKNTLKKVTNIVLGKI